MKFLWSSESEREKFVKAGIIPDVYEERKSNPYETLNEAKEAVQKLNSVPKGKKEYHELYKKDPRLPSNPNRTYKKGWTGWNDFLGTEKLNPYETLNEAKEAVRKLNPVPKNWRKYHELYKQDLRLPSHPDRNYKDEWTDWNDFLGTKERNKERNKEKGIENLNKIKKLGFYPDGSRGRFPRRSSKDQEEKRLAQWIKNRKQAKKGNGTGKFNYELEEYANKIGLTGIFKITSPRAKTF